MLSKNQIVTLTIENITNEGMGVGRFEGMAVFVAESAPGDVLRVRIVKVSRNLCYGIVEEIVEPSTFRIQPNCHVFGRCGGCALRHIDYDAELSIKNGWVKESLQRIGGVNPPMLPPIGSGEDRYRNKAIFPVRTINGKIVIGFFARRSHRVIEPGDCLLHPAEFALLAEALRGWMEENNVSAYDEELHKGSVRALFLRKAEATGQIMACVVSKKSGLPNEPGLIDALRAACPAVCSVILNTNAKKTNVLLGASCRTLWGTDTITDRLGGILVTLSPLSFYQINRAGAERLYAVAADYAGLTGKELLIDLYCGAGTIGLSLANKAAQLIGVEIVPEAVEDAIRNAAANGITNARFLCADAGEAARQLEKEGLHPDVIILDPPRKGCDAAVINTAVRMAPKRIVMVSCDSATAARDIAAFEKLGYKAEKAQTVDMFPRTAHVETVVLMSRVEK